MTIRYKTGNLLDSPAQALVNTVNELGVMGKGIALQFKETFPASAADYEEAARAERVNVGRMLVTLSGSLQGPRWIIHFPTKKHWRHPSRIEWIRAGLADLANVIQREGIESIALPPLGCGNGGLDWPRVRAEIELALGGLPDVEVTVYEPTDVYYNAPKRTGVEELTPARALIAELVRRYSVLGFECSLIEVQKLAWFASRAMDSLGIDDPLKLRFEAHRYGPYDDRLRHLLEALDGSYLHCERRLADARPLDVIRFDDAKRDAVAAYLRSEDGASCLAAIEMTEEVMDGFESPFGMELLATVDWLVQREATQPNVEALRKAIARWPGGGSSAARRKAGLFDERTLGMALDRLAEVFGDSMSASRG